MEPVNQVEGRAIPFGLKNADTDIIIPARWLKTVTREGLGRGAFEALRADPDNVFDKPEFKGAPILIAGDNFGCGSSREHAPQAIARFGKGIVAILGESFAEIFYGNCQSLGVPCPTLDAASIEELMSLVEADPKLELTVDLEKQEVKAGSRTFSFSMPDGPKRAFIEGTWDPTFELLSAKEQIQKTAASLPYMNGFTTAP